MRKFAVQYIVNRYHSALLDPVFSELCQARAYRVNNRQTDKPIDKVVFMLDNGATDYSKRDVPDSEVCQCCTEFAKTIKNSLTGIRG
jgi:hypothetical protein